MNQTTEIATIREDKPLTATDIRAQVNLIQEVMAGVMREDVHYGVIPGCKEKSLYKAGAEKISSTFRLSVDPEIDDLSNSDESRYQVKVRLVSPSGVFVGAGIGECSSNEEKYKWRYAVCDEEFEETPEDRRREKWKKGWNGKPNYKIKQVRTETADLRNTILKMAKKRAMVDAVLTATAASDIFTQDIEDLPDEYRDSMSETRSAKQEQEAPQSNAPEGLTAKLESSARKGLKDLLTAWQELTDEQRKSVGTDFGRIKKIAESVK